MTRIHFPCYFVLAEFFFALSIEINSFYDLIL